MIPTNNDLVTLIGGVSGPMNDLSVRDKITELENDWKKLPQVDIPVSDGFFGGIYAREITIPAGTFLTGRIYKDDHWDIMVSGDITISSDDGINRIQGFHVFRGKQGKKRAGYAHEDTRWITFCKSEEMHIEAHLDHLTVETFDQLNSVLSERKPYLSEGDILAEFEKSDSEDYQAFKAGYLAASTLPSKLEADITDYEAVLLEYGFTESIARSQSENLLDQVCLSGDFGVEVKGSDIEGKGLYSTKEIKAGAVIMPGRVKGKRTIAGRYTNHSIEPNAIMVMNGEDINLIATRNIGSEEITVDYRVCLGLQLKKVA